MENNKSHTPAAKLPVGEWEKKFDDKFVFKDDEGFVVKSFITAEKAKSYEEGYVARGAMESKNKLGAQLFGQKEGAAQAKREIAEKIKGKQYNHRQLHGTIDCEPCAYADILSILTPDKEGITSNDKMQ